MLAPYPLSSSSSCGKSSLDCQHHIHKQTQHKKPTLGELGLTAGWLAENGSARAALDDGRRVGEDGGDLEAAGALNVHEERVGDRHNLLELVGAGLNLRGGVEKVNGESLGLARSDGDCWLMDTMVWDGFGCARVYAGDRSTRERG